MKKRISILIMAVIVIFLTVPTAYSFFGVKFEKLTPENRMIKIPVNKIDDGKAHYFMAKADDGIMVSFFTLKSSDGIIRAAIDACDVCFRSGKGYIQQGDFMVCTNCGQKFPSSRINVIKGGCNPAPLERSVEGEFLVIKMDDINKNSWYCKFKKL